MKVYGPYTRKDGRKHIIIVDDDGTRRTVSYPKYLMEQHLGRELDPDLETVDHIDGNFNNNDLSNLRVVPRAQHAREDVLRVRMVSFHCVFCGKEGQQNARDMDSNRKHGKAGPFCSKSCSGKYGALIQHGLIDPFEVDKVTVEREYYKDKPQ